MLPGQLLALIEYSLRTAPPPPAGWLFRRTPVVMELNVPVCFGQRGRYVRDEDGVALYGYTKGQCEAIRDVVHAAIRQDADLE
jgi:hypothetical protein